MKHPKRINLAMKKLITANGLNPKDYWFLKFLRVTIHKSVDKSIESMEFQEYKKFNTFRGYK